MRWFSAGIFLALCLALDYVRQLEESEDKRKHDDIFASRHSGQRRDEAREVAISARTFVETNPQQAEKLYWYAISLDAKCDEAWDGLRSLGAA